MAQLTNPLSVGRYWIDLIGPDKAARFASWMANPSLGGKNARTISTEYHAENTSMLPGTASTPERTWALFEVTSPVFWDFAFYGSPTPAAATVSQEADTIQSPDVEDMKWVPDLRNVGQGIEDAVKTGVAVVAGVAVLAGLVWVASNVLGKKGR